MPRASMQQREAKEKGERSSRLRPGRVHRTNDSAAACHRHGKEPVSTRPACQSVLSRQR